MNNRDYIKALLIIVGGAAFALFADWLLWEVLA